MTAVRIVVDVHEERTGVPEVLRAELGADVEVAPLPAGDYAVGADTLIERKRVRDLHSAVIKGRLWPQLAKLRAAAAFPYLLLESTDVDRGPLAANAVRGVCLAVRCQRVEPAADRPDYAQRPKARAEDAGEAMLAAVPGISTGSARALLERFGSVAAVIAADPAEWLTVPGIGRDRARALEEALRGRPVAPVQRR